MKISNISEIYSFRNFLFLLLILTIGATSGLFIASSWWTPIKSDGLGYHSYLPALFNYGDLDMVNIREFFHQDVEKYPENWAGFLYQESTGKYLNKFPVGVAVMSAPFFIIADALTPVFNLERNGFSDLYQIMNAISAIFYLIVGSYFLHEILRKRFSEAISLTTLIAIIFGTNLFHYATYDSSFSHIYSFALFAMFIYFVEKYFEERSRRTIVILGVVLGLAVLVRQTNLLILTIPLLYSISNRKTLKDHLKNLWESKIDILKILLITFLIFIPQMLYWRFSTGNFLAFSYQGEYFDFFHPEILNVLFSVRKGLFFWSPILFFSIPGIVFMFRKKDKLSLSILLYLIFQTYLISSWWAWFYGFAYGHRAFTESFVMFAIPLAYFFKWLSRFKERVTKTTLIMVIGFLILLSLFQMQQYWRGLIPGDGTTIEKYQKIFLRPCLNVGIEWMRCE